MFPGIHDASSVWSSQLNHLGRHRTEVLRSLVLLHRQPKGTPELTVPGESWSWLGDLWHRHTECELHAGHSLGSANLAGSNRKWPQVMPGWV